MRSPSPSTVNFADWKAGVTDEDEAAATAMAGLEMLRSGFTMFIEPGSLFSTEAGAEAVGRVGIRALFAPLYLWDRQECFDAVPSLMSPSLAARAPINHERAMAQIGSELHLNKDPEALVRGYIFVYGAGTASPELLQRRTDPLGTTMFLFICTRVSCRGKGQSIAASTERATSCICES